MPEVADVATYILAQAGPMAAMKLHRLLYFAFGYHLAWEDRLLFDEPFHAWANGPAVSVLYELHRGLYWLELGHMPGRSALIDDQERESVDAVLDAYASLGAHALSEATHQEPPWILARERAGVGALDRSDEPLRVAEIAEHFQALIATGEESELRYADKADAPLSLATLTALRDALKSGDHARYRKSPAPAEPESVHVEMTREEWDDAERLSLARLDLTYQQLEK